MRIMTYNIRLGIQQGLEPIAQIVRAAGADIVALQEVGCHWSMGPPGDTLATLAVLSGLEHSVYAPALVVDQPGGGKERYGHGLLSRWPISASHIVKLAQIEDEPRVLLYSTVETSGGALKILSTHLSHLPSDRPTHAGELQRAGGLLAAEGVAAVIMGDLNESPEVEWVQMLQRTWTDADATASRLTFPAPEPNVRIDYLFCQRGRWHDVEVIDEREASDHRAVVARLALI
ncbi:MAG: endonuclease/exonuclease/phosphatase family protein [Bradymonadaceae bacterium]|nr:endonuclease/exonuclease/phosphatase family protein [Lujinxingiaceae bacterium]